MASRTVSILDALEHHAQRSPSQPFVIDLTCETPQTWTYARALADVERLAAALRSDGVAPGDRVAMRLANSWSFVAVLLAILRTGAVAVPTIRQYSPEELTYSLADCGTQRLVFDDDDVDEFVKCLPPEVTPISASSHPSPRGLDTLDALRRRGAAAPAAAAISTDADAMIFYTSGTTSRPKGVVLDHGAILDSCLISADGLRLRASDRGFIVLPLFHCNALFMQLVPLLLAGATAVVTNHFSARSYVASLREHHITLANLTAGAIRSVLAQPEDEQDREHRLRMLTFALPLREDEIRRVEERFGVPAFMAYGLTESCCGGTRTPLHTDPRSGWQSLGVAQCGWDVAVLGEDGAALPPGDIGEIVLRGPGVMDRYWNRPQETAEVKRGGWLHTGDLGALDTAGFLYFHSRVKDMLKPKGENVAASEIEAIIDSHPVVAASAVVGVFDPHHEERIVAFVAGPGDERDTQAILAHCRQLLASFKVPSELHWLDEMPQTSVGKINKGRLRSLAEAMSRPE